MKIIRFIASDDCCILHHLFLKGETVFMSTTFIEKEKPSKIVFDRNRQYLGIFETEDIPEELQF